MCIETIYLGSDTGPIYTGCKCVSHFSTDVMLRDDYGRIKKMPQFHEGLAPCRSYTCIYLIHIESFAHQKAACVKEQAPPRYGTRWNTRTPHHGMDVWDGTGRDTDDL
jgi:hypothetical protein